MPRGLSKSEQDYAREVFERLKAKFGSQENVAAKLRELMGDAKLSQSTVSKAAAGRTSMQVLVAAIHLAGMPQAEVIRKLGAAVAAEVATMSPAGAYAFDPPVMSFLADMGELPGYRSWLRSQPQLRLSQAARIAEMFHTHPPKTDGDGVPHDGWDGFASDVLDGRIDRQICSDRHQERAEDIESLHLRRANTSRHKKDN